jgi:hypothetical protein
VIPPIDENPDSDIALWLKVSLRERFEQDRRFEQDTM